ncbi:RNA polymerase sigma factor [Frateuria aurantia]|uniref:RNA polymerase sigma factor, sigma-70 family n=1 Tax=Frateuria aurantia (strain ATCC 33424 / DSM 6220 / KCTC 2777 / LMG 1558 / NBRC 3245 / NCIMB 13370) TaxID=767434 RepID=H8KYU7_FRAAD|nr:sigma-70 family RNA polymerase sigma factor [Frateuria aurantia]AFC86168.1 RNA polymerase sigma factor, sigma-70 family [Frateuria aurantia DSM 6220]
MSNLVSLFHRDREPSEGAAEPGPLASERVSQVAELFRAHNSALIAFLRTRLSSASEAQEVAQEAYTRLLRMDDPGRIQQPKALLFRTAANLASDRIRKRSVRLEAPLDDLFMDWLESPGPERRALLADEMRVIREALRELPAKTSRAFVMHLIQDMSFSTISQSMGVTERMVRYHVARALAHCRQRLEETGGKS